MAPNNWPSLPGVPRTSGRVRKSLPFLGERAATAAVTWRGVHALIERQFGQFDEHGSVEHKEDSCRAARQPVRSSGAWGQRLIRHLGYVGVNYSAQQLRARRAAEPLVA